ncbi:hypothetical protein HY024_04005 [Candidatus Curtissbacteria bacterium]|nr:hypothetical protein [Candidatus Curtissbacteria bacterium]
MENFNLQNIAKIIKNDIVLISFLVIALLLAIVSGFALINSKPEIKGTPWQSIEPGKTTTDQIKKVLGDPQESSNSGQTLMYSKKDDKRQIAVDIQNNKATVIKEPVTHNEEGDLNSYIQKFGQPEKILYGPDETAAPGHFWGQRGILVFGNPISGIILEIWYFPPTDLRTFLSQHPELKPEPTQNRP